MFTNVTGGSILLILHHYSPS